VSVVPSIRLEHIPFISHSNRVSVPSLVILFRLTHSSVSLLVSRDYSDLDYFSLPSHSIRVSPQFVPTKSSICSLHLIQLDRVYSFSHSTQLMVLIRPILGRCPVLHSPDTNIPQTLSHLSRSTRLWLPLTHTNSAVSPSISPNWIESARRSIQSSSSNPSSHIT